MSGIKHQNYVRYLQQLSGARSISWGGVDRVIATRFVHLRLRLRVHVHLHLRV